MFGADVIILELVRFGLRGIERLLQIAPGVGIVAALNFVAAREFLFQIRLELGGRHADARQQFRHEAFVLVDEREQQMLAIHLLMRMFAGDALRVLQRLLRFLGQLVELHDGNLAQSQRTQRGEISNTACHDEARHRAFSSEIIYAALCRGSRYANQAASISACDIQIRPARCLSCWKQSACTTENIGNSGKYTPKIKSQK